MGRTGLGVLCSVALVVLAGFRASVPIANAQGMQTVHSLLVNGIPGGGVGNAHVANDVAHLQAALNQEVRPHVITLSNPANWAGLTDAIAAAFGAADGDDLCLFYLGTHGGQVADDNGDEGDGMDGRFQVGADLVRDDDFDTPFNARLAAGNCGAGMVLMFMVCRSGELIVGGNDFALGGVHVVMTSCTSPQASSGGLVGGHAHSFYGGNGLVRGLSDTNANGAAEADGNPAPNPNPPPAFMGGDVTASELHAYAVANDGDAGADPQSTAPGSALIVLRYDTPAAHNRPVRGFRTVPLQEDITFCAIPSVTLFLPVVRK